MMINNLTFDIATAYAVSDERFNDADAMLRNLNPDSTDDDRRKVLAQLDTLINH